MTSFTDNVPVVAGRRVGRPLCPVGRAAALHWATRVGFSCRCPTFAPVGGRHENDPPVWPHIGTRTCSRHKHKQARSDRRLLSRRAPAAPIASLVISGRPPNPFQPGQTEARPFIIFVSSLSFCCFGGFAARSVLAPNRAVPTPTLEEPLTLASRMFSLSFTPAHHRKLNPDPRASCNGDEMAPEAAARP